MKQKITHILPTSNRHLVSLKKCSNKLMLNGSTLRHLFLWKVQSVRAHARVLLMCSPPVIKILANSLT